MTDSSTQHPDDGVWDRLRRRKLVQWGLAYAAGAWGFQQGLAYVSTLLGWPVQVQRLTGLALLIGLPIALVLAWYHGDRGQRQVKRGELAILTVLFLLGGGAFWYYQRASETGKDAAPIASAVEREPSPTIKDARPSVAVLPFENRSDESKDAYFVDGIHDDILTQLSKVSAITLSWSSVTAHGEKKGTKACATARS